MIGWNPWIKERVAEKGSGVRLIEAKGTINNIIYKNFINKKIYIKEMYKIIEKT